MPSNPGDIAALVFEGLISREDVNLVIENGECHIMADDWTLLLIGDPISEVIVALDDESGPPEAALQKAMSDKELTTIRNLDGQLGGQVSAGLDASPDEYARALARMILD